MDRELKQKILGLEPTREVPIDVSNLVTLEEGQPHLLEETFPYVEVPRVTFEGRVYEQIDGEQVEFDFFNYFEDMAYNAGPLVGPNIFRKFLMPRYRRINDHLRAHGVKHIWLDSDGNTEVLIPLMIETGITCHWPLERVAGMDPLKIREEYGHDLALGGGIDKRPLAQGREAIERELYHHVPQLIEDGGYIPMIDHTVPPETSYDDFMYYMDLKRKLIRG